MAEKALIALLTNNDDDVYCFRLELIKAMMDAGFRVLISCPDGPKFDVMDEMGLRKNQEFIYDDPPIDRRGTSVKKDYNLMQHYKKLFKPVIALLTTAVAIAIYALFIVFLYDKTGYSGIIYQLLKFIIGCLMVYTVLTLSVAMANRNVKVFTLLFGNTFSIYILSWPCQAFAEIALNRILHLHWIIVILSMFTVGLAVPLFIVWLYKKISGKSKIMNCLLGIY